MKKEKNIIQNQSIDSMEIAARSKQLLEGLGGPLVAAAMVNSPLLVSSLLAAGAYSVGKLFAGEEKGSDNDDKILETLQRTSLNAEVASSGQVLTTVNTAAQPQPVSEQPVVVEKRQDATIIQIQNLTINLTVDMVQQLNVSPDKVINQLTEQIKEATFNAIAQQNSNQEPSGPET